MPVLAPVHMGHPHRDRLDRSVVRDGVEAFESDRVCHIAAGLSDVDVVVSGLALNFVPEPTYAVAESIRVAKPGATVAAYVWDYAGEMQMMRWFWDTAVDSLGSCALPAGMLFIFST